MPEPPEQHLQYPILTLQMEPRQVLPTGGGKDESKIVRSRLLRQQKVLGSACNQIYQHRANYPTFASKVHLIISMFRDSFATSFTPQDLFNEDIGCCLVAPLTGGYLIEADIDNLPQLAEKFDKPNTTATRVDISRVEKLSAFDRETLLHRFDVDKIWETALESDEGKLFTIRLMPLHDSSARRELMATINHLSSKGILFPEYLISFPWYENSDTPSKQPMSTKSVKQTGIEGVLTTYNITGFARASVIIQGREALKQLVLSGSSYRIDPIRPLSNADLSKGFNPGPAVPDVAGQPIVGVVDGGLTSSKYKHAEAWLAPKFVDDYIADSKHGNCVSSLVVHGHELNNNLTLPALNCRVGTVQAITRPGTKNVFSTEDLVGYLELVAADHPDTHIWNISANVYKTKDEPDMISDFGDSLARWARKQGVLPIVSVGNVNSSNSETGICSPADCEAALVVGGRLADDKGNPGNGCPNCLPGPGPQGMLKPDLSWFSTLCMIDGVTECGSSYATPLISVLAAHTFNRLKEPSPDLVRALLINMTEQNRHKSWLGWGTPYHGNLPWNCAPGMVILAWKATLMPGTAYYWDVIPIPSELTRDKKLFGKARLTAILNPHVSPLAGPNYFSSRLETSLQYQKEDCKWYRMLKPMQISSVHEQSEQYKFNKWQPVRSMYRDFTKNEGLSYCGNHMRLYGRIYTRDSYLFRQQNDAQPEPHDVVFVLTFEAADDDAPIYNSMAQMLGNNVESAVKSQMIEIEV